MPILGWVLFIAGCLALAIFIAWLILRKLYKRASKETSFVRTGFGGQKVVINGGALVLPALHEIIPVNMNTLRLEVTRANNQALITHDRMRVDVQAEFYVRVKPTGEAVADAAQTLGRRTTDPKALKDLVEGKFVDVLRAVAAEMAMDELHVKRGEFVQRVKTAVADDLLKNGLELESVSLTALDQTDQSYFNPQNAFDAQGLTALTEAIQARRKQRNAIEQDTEVAVRRKNLETEQQKLELAREEEYARLQQQREIETRRAEQQAEIIKERSEREQQAKAAQIEAKLRVDRTQILADRTIEEEQIAKDLFLRQKDIAREKALEEARIEREKSLSLTEQDRAIAIAEKSKASFASEAEAARARALAAVAEEQVATARQIEVAERQKAIELVEAHKMAEQETINLTLAAEARKKAAVDQAEAMRILSDGEADKIKKAAEAEAEAAVIRAGAAKKRYQIDAEGARALNEAENILDPNVIALRVKMAVIERMGEIIRESVKPLESIEGIKIINVSGLTPEARGVAAPADEAAAGPGLSLTDQVVNSALRYRGQAPLIDALLREVGLSGGDIDGLTSVLKGEGKEKDEPKKKD